MTFALQDAPLSQRTETRPVWVFATSSAPARSTTSPATATLLDLGAGGTEPALAKADQHPTAKDAARFLSQSSFGVTSIDQIEALRQEGFEHWLWSQFNAPSLHHISHLNAQRLPLVPQATLETSFEAIWQHWIDGADQLRCRVAFALAQITVVANVAPALGPYALSSCMDLINRNAFGNYRSLLKEMAHHPAMGHYIFTVKNTHPNPMQAMLQLFSIGSVALNLNGTMPEDDTGKPRAAVLDAEINTWSNALSNWAMALQNPAASTRYQAAEKALDEVLEQTFNHPNVGPFLGRQLINKLVTSNPSPTYVQRVAGVFNDNGAGVRGDLQAVVRAILLDTEARTPTDGQVTSYGTQREPAIRFATFLRALGSHSTQTFSSMAVAGNTGNKHQQTHLKTPSVFNFFSNPNQESNAAAQPSGMMTKEPLTHEAAVVGSLSFFSSLIKNEGYRWGSCRLSLNLKPLVTLAPMPALLVDRLDALLFGGQMDSSTRQRLVQMLGSMPQKSEWNLKKRVQAALMVIALSPDFVLQK